MALRVLAHVGGLSLACGVAGCPRWTLAAAALPASVLAYTALGACTQAGVGLTTVQGTLWPSLWLSLWLTLWPTLWPTLWASLAHSLARSLGIFGHLWPTLGRADASGPRVGMLDGLLLMGHRWDAMPELQAVLNCWIFYTACSGALLLLAVMS